MSSSAWSLTDVCVKEILEPLNTVVLDDQSSEIIISTWLVYSVDGSFGQFSTVQLLRGISDKLIRWFCKNSSASYLVRLWRWLRSTKISPMHMGIESLHWIRIADHSSSSSSLSFVKGSILLMDTMAMLAHKQNSKFVSPSMYHVISSRGSMKIV